jgi:hypothetical protein
MPTADEYRREAAVLREKAGKEANPIIRAQLIAAAEMCDEMADNSNGVESPPQK